MDIDRQKITVAELLTRYADGERDFSNVSIYNWREGLMSGVDLSGINLEGSFLEVDFSGATLRKANMRHTIWGDHCDWKEADFSGSDMTGINIESGCVFTRCNFSNTIWNQASLFQSTFEDCDLAGVNFAHATLAEVRFTR